MANLVLNGKSIDTIEEIAENFVEADVLREFQSGSLAAWLEEYDYKDELARIRAIKSTASNIRLLSGIIDALNLDDDVIARANTHREEQCEERAIREVEVYEGQQNKDEGHVINVAIKGEKAKICERDDATIDHEEGCTVYDTDIVFDCPHCGRNLCVDQRAAGLQITCVVCGGVVLVPKVEDCINVADNDIVFDCPHCGQLLCIDCRGAGLQIDCTNCGKPLLVPIPDSMTGDDSSTGAG